MRHVKLRPEREIDATALIKLIEAAYTDMKTRLTGQQGSQHSSRPINSDSMSVTHVG